MKEGSLRQGRHYEEVLHQRANDIRLMKGLGLELPDWAGSVAAAEAAKVGEPPTAQ